MGKSTGSVVSRRGFLAGSLLAPFVGPQIVGAATLGKGGGVAANERLQIGSIGLGSRGSGHVNTLIGRNEAQVVAVCDPFLSKCEANAARVNKAYGGTACGAYQDYRELLAQDDVDAVFVASPENWHALHDLAAMEAGKDVYGEKALALTVGESRAVVDGVRRLGRVFQVGMQQRSGRDFRFACELARNGYLGKLHTVRVGVPAGTDLPEAPPTPPPADLDYEIWLGPAPYTPHNDLKCSYNWYFMTDYCAGWVQSWGVHHIDTAQWGAPALTRGKLRVKGTAEFPRVGLGDTSTAWQIEYRTDDGLLLVFSDNVKQQQGCRFEGNAGWVHVNRSGIWAEPASLLGVEIKPDEEHLYVSEDHHTNFFDCVRTGRDPVAPVEAGHTANAITLIGDIATRLRRELTWDWAAERFTDCEDANRMLARSMRAPWAL